jgi:hypothetical protein
MLTSSSRRKTRKKYLSNEMDLWDSVHIRTSKHDVDVYRIISDGFLLIPTENLSKEYANSVRNTREYRARLIDNLVILSENKWKPKKKVIKVYLLHASFKPDIDKFYIVASVYKPEPLALLILEERRELVLADCPLHHVVLAERAAREALKELEETESDTSSTRPRSDKRILDVQWG